MLTRTFFFTIFSNLPTNYFFLKLLPSSPIIVTIGIEFYSKCSKKLVDMTELTKLIFNFVYIFWSQLLLRNWSMCLTLNSILFLQNTLFSIIAMIN